MVEGIMERWVEERELWASYSQVAGLLEICYPLESRVTPGTYTNRVEPVYQQCAPKKADSGSRAGHTVFLVTS